MFYNLLTVEQLDETYWRLTEDLIYRTCYERYTIPKGFITDFASVPWFFRIIFPTYGKYTRSAVLHDYLSQEWGFCYTADREFFVAMSIEGTVWWRKYPIYWGVRLHTHYINAKLHLTGILNSI